MAVKDINVLKTAKFARECIPFPITTATSQTDVRAGAVVPGFAFEIVKVSTYVSALTAGLTCDVKIGTTSVLTGAITPATASSGIVDGTLSSTVATRRGSATDAINVHYTTDSDAAGTNFRVTVWIRPVPLHDESRNT